MHEGDQPPACPTAKKSMETKDIGKTIFRANPLPILPTGGQRNFFSPDCFYFPSLYRRPMAMLPPSPGEVHCTSVPKGLNFSPGQKAFAESSPPCDSPDATEKVYYRNGEVVRRRTEMEARRTEGVSQGCPPEGLPVAKAPRAKLALQQRYRK